MSNEKLKTWEEANVDVKQNPVHKIVPWRPNSPEIPVPSNVFWERERERENKEE